MKSLHFANLPIHNASESRCQGEEWNYLGLTHVNIWIVTEERLCYNCQARRVLPTQIVCNIYTFMARLIMNHSIAICDECESEYYQDTSKMSNLCPECSSILYGYENCVHKFKMVCVCSVFGMGACRTITRYWRIK